MKRRNVLLALIVISLAVYLFAMISDTEKDISQDAQHNDEPFTNQVAQENAERAVVTIDTQLNLDDFEEVSQYVQEMACEKGDYLMVENQYLVPQDITRDEILYHAFYLVETLKEAYPSLFSVSISYCEDRDFLHDHYCPVADVVWSPFGRTDNEIDPIPIGDYSKHSFTINYSLLEEYILEKD